MPVVNRIAEFADEMKEWRRDLHRHPELLYDVFRTSGLVADRLRAFGCDEVATGIGRTGVVGIIRGRGEGRVIGLRADMDALPILEASGVAHASTTPGKMHACGHDGHTTMLLGAARYLCETRNFSGAVAVIFQPAEEGGGGGKAMCEDGMMDRFAISEVYGMHNMPGIDVGAFAIRPGALMAAADRFDVSIEGVGAHAAKPHESIDPILVGSAFVQAAQAIVSRGVDPLEACVVSITRFEAGNTYNVIPQTAALAGTVRTLSPSTRDFAEARLREICAATGAAYRAKLTLRYSRGYPVTENHPRETEFAASVAASIVGASRVDSAVAPTMGAEDFSFMLLERPGAFIFVGNGASAGLHHPAYDFNDEAIPIGASYWARLVETALPAP